MYLFSIFQVARDDGEEEAPEPLQVHDEEPEATGERGQEYGAEAAGL